METIELKKIINKLGIIMVGVALLISLISEHMNSDIWIIVILFILLSQVIDLYLEIINKQYFTVKFIVVIEFIEIILFIFLCYFLLKKIDETNFELLWQRESHIRHINLIIIIMSLIKSILKSQRFEKKTIS